MSQGFVWRKTGSVMNGLTGGTVFLLCAITALMPSARSQQIYRLDRERAETMLETVSSDVRTYYFDAKLHGLDWDALVRETKQRIDQAPNITVANADIEALLENLDDSHTNFFPSPNAVTADYGWRFKVVGNRSLVTEVHAKSDAESKGMLPGDEVLTIDGFAVDRVGAKKLEYAMNLMPRSSLQLVLRDPAGKILRLTVNSDVHRHGVITNLSGSSWYITEIMMKREDAWLKERAQYKDLGPDLMVLKVPAFFQTGLDVDEIFKKARAHKTLIVDLRGCPGGRSDSLNDYLGDIFNHEVKLGGLVQRNKVTPAVVKGRGVFSGNLIVLIDSETASAGEIFSRVVQLQERGTIIGDHSSGHTMESEVYVHSTGQNPRYVYGDSITIADTVMADGKSLEHIGVEPDRTFLPKAADIAAGRDPVLAYAAELAGVTLSPEDAAKVLPPKRPEE